MSVLRLTSMFGDYPITEPIKAGTITSDRIAFDMADVSLAQTAFKRAVRDVEFDVSELAIVTYLMAKAEGVPLTVIPACVLGRYQHPYIIHNADRGPLSPEGLSGKRVGIRSYTVTTVMWLRGILQNDYGVDLESIQWTTFEDAHVRQFSDPPGVVRAPSGADLKTMLLNGDIDAAILPGTHDDPRLQPVITNPATAAAAWGEKHSALHTNHLVAVKESLCDTHPDVPAEVYRLLQESKAAAGLPAPGKQDMQPFGLENLRPSLEMAIFYTYQQGLIPRRYEVDELFHDATRTL